MSRSKRRSPIETPAIEPARPIELRPRGDFLEWLAAAGGALAVTTYNSGKLALFSAADGKLAASYWRFPRPMGVAVAGNRLALAAQRHLWMFQITDGCAESGSETPPTIQLGEGRSARLETVFTTGKLDAHDVAFDRRGVLFANTKFNCVARPSERVDFLRTWRPAFIEQSTRGDCCHLNGLGIRSGRLGTVTAFCESGTPAAWRAGDRFTSGVLIDVQRNRIAAGGLCMPHSPRWHEGRWWLCNSGDGTLCRADLQSGEFEALDALPGFTRGLTFADGRAVVGLSRIRKRHILDAPPVRERFPRMRSGVWLVDPASGASTGSLEFVRGGREVYDVAYLSPRPGEP